ncbi:MAG: TIGR02172 family protein [Prevotella sp.]|nr:TIGR02172 family protein [Prevotella sp.]
MNNDVQKINLDEYVQSGEGGQALTYTRKDNSSLAKLFMLSYGAETAQREFLVSKAVYEAGIPSPKPIRLVTDGERFGGEYELIAGKRSYARIISEEPEQLEPLTIRFAKLAKEIHGKAADTEIFPDMKDVVKIWIEKSECITEPLRQRLLETLESIPSPKTYLHGDLHVGNIITNGTKEYWIDLGNFAWGAPEWDFSMIYFTAFYMAPERTDYLFHLTPATLQKHWALLIKTYYGFQTEEQLHDYEKHLLKFVALKLFYNFCKRYNGKGQPVPQLEGMANAFLNGIAPGLKV